MARKRFFSAKTRRRWKKVRELPLRMKERKARIIRERDARLKRRQRAEWTIAQNVNRRAGETMAKDGVPTFAAMRAEAERQQAEASVFGDWAIPTGNAPKMPVSRGTVKTTRNGREFTRSPKAGHRCGAKTQAGGQCRHHLGDDGMCQVKSHNRGR